MNPSPSCDKNAAIVYGDGMQTRSFCYVDDLVERLIRLMETVTALLDR